MRVSKQKTWDTLRNAYLRRGLVFFLGAGVSLATGVPTWDELVNRLAGSRDSGGVRDALQGRGFSLPMIASVLEDHFRSRGSFIEALRHELYCDTPLAPLLDRNVGSTLRKKTSARFVTAVIKKNSTLRAIAAFCCRKSGRTFVPNARVKAVVSFNLDNLLEAYSEARYRQTIFRSVIHPGSTSAPSLINVHHIHGIIPPTGTVGRVVITENDFFDVFGESVGAHKYTVLYLLREFTCVFVGLSLRDDNLRQLLHYSRRERMEAIGDRVPERYRDHALNRHFAVLQRDETRVDESIARGLKRLGVTPIWIDAYEEIAYDLAYVYEAGGSTWESVFDPPAGVEAEDSPTSS